MLRKVLPLALLLLAVPALAGDVKLSGSIRGRAESWSFFQTPGYDSDYTFFAALLRVSAAQQVNPNLDWQLELASPMLWNLPDDAIAPAPRGQLGFGASYYAANGDSDTASIFPKNAFVRFKSGSNMIRAGRFEFSDGTEVTPKNAMLAAVKSSRVAYRLIGNFAFSHAGRSLDGVHYAYDTPKLNVTALAFRPTVGAFNVDGLADLEHVTAFYGAATWSRANADERLFVIAYRDERGLVKTDNRPAAARNLDREDIDLVTLGGHYLAAFGNADVLAWGAWQTGDWGALDHDATAVALEAGYHFKGDRKPTVRAGLFRASGDDDASDGEHGTFFQVLPTPRVYARFPFYNAMNSTDAFVHFSIKPHPKVTLTSEAHLLSLTEQADLWYAGGGAFEKSSFGFAGRPANNHDDLARVIDLGVDYALNPKTSLTIYGAHANGGAVVDAIFAESGASLVYVEVMRRF
ncbi:MAG TPA: alginate export family protein [Thermoanaerobaculia bacterium]|nr:alginate export family protein [Thermoanaerobaculia bacterium]